MTVSFLTWLSPDFVKSGIGGRIFVISVPVSLISPSRKHFLMNATVSAGFRPSSEMMASSSCFLARSMKRSHSSVTEPASGFRLSMKESMRSFLLRRFGLEATFRRMSAMISRSCLPESLNFSTRKRM